MGLIMWFSSSSYIPFSCNSHEKLKIKFVRGNREGGGGCLFFFYDLWFFEVLCYQVKDMAEPQVLKYRILIN